MDYKLSKGDPRCVMNYRPISLLPLPSKILERILHNHLLNHLLSNNFLSPRQFGFRPGSSTEEALLFDWSSHLASVAAVFFDLSKAFVTKFHIGLLSLMLECPALFYTGFVVTYLIGFNELSLTVTSRKFTQLPLVYPRVPFWALFCSPSM